MFWAFFLARKEVDDDDGSCEMRMHALKISPEKTKVVGIIMRCVQQGKGKKIKNMSLKEKRNNEKTEGRGLVRFRVESPNE